MEFIYIIVGVLAALGIGVTVIERRRGRSFHIERIGDDIDPQESAEQIRIEDELRNRTYFGNNH
ncbi:MAG: hypothetical protein ABF248_06545 [Yoonia sp.]